MLSIVEEFVVQDAMRAGRFEHPRSVNQQDGGVLDGHRAVRLTEHLRAAHRHAVVLASLHIVPTCLVPVATLLEEPSQPVMRFGEFGMAPNQFAVDSHRLGRGVRLQGSRRGDSPRKG